MKNIDKIFNESLKNYERQPRTEAWEKLQARLEKKDSKILPLWWKYASAASVALLLGVGGYWFTSQKKVQNDWAIVLDKPVLKKEVEIVKQVEVAKIKDVKSEKKIIKISCPIGEININSNISPVAGVHWDTQFSPPVRKQTQDLDNQNNPIIALETIKTKTPPEENTIVLVLENTKPKKEEETIVLNFVDTKVEMVAQNIEPEKKQSRVGKIWEQLKRAKNGENVNWGEVGVKPQKVLARADAKIENALTRGESNDR